MASIFLQPSDYHLEIVGEKSYQKALRKIAMYEYVDKDSMEDKTTGLTAQLILEDENKFDPGNAVRIDIEGQTVGYLAQDNATEYRMALKNIMADGQICECQATAYGKREEIGKPMIYGIWLAIDLNKLVVGSKPRKKFLGLF